jgi:hypothetical protein
MQKPVVFNRFLQKKWNDHENEMMLNKLLNAKSSLNKDCPESFTFFQKKNKKSKNSNSVNEVSKEI